MSNVHLIAKRIVEEIKDLELVRRPDVQARKRMWSDDGTEEMRPLHMGVTVVPGDVDGAGGTNERENVAYQYEVMLRASSASDSLDEDWAVATWEGVVRRRFQFRRIGDLPDTVCELHCVVGRSKQPVGKKLAEGEDVSVLSLTCFVREPRNDD